MLVRGAKAVEIRDRCLMLPIPLARSRPSTVLGGDFLGSVIQPTPPTYPKKIEETHRFLFPRWSYFYRNELNNCLLLKNRCSKYRLDSMKSRTVFGFNKAFTYSRVTATLSSYYRVGGGGYKRKRNDNSSLTQAGRMLLMEFWYLEVFPKEEMCSPPPSLGSSSRSEWYLQHTAPKVTEESVLLLLCTNYHSSVFVFLFYYLLF